MNKRQVITFYMQKAPQAIKTLMHARPDLFAGGGLSGMGDALSDALAAGADQSAASTDWLTQISNAAQKLLPIYQQQQLLDANLQLAMAGRPTINAGQIAPQFNVGLSSGTLLILAGLAALFIFR